MQRFIGIVLGALVTLALLKLQSLGSDPTPNYLVAVIAGAIVAWLWPWLIGIYLVRRAKQRRSDQIDKEVAEQVAAQTKH